jgi:hypothetical protein
VLYKIKNHIKVYDMNKGMLILVAMVACILMSVGGCSTKPDLLVNGGFEPQSALQKSIGDWYATELPRTKEFVSFEWDDQVVHTGKRSVSIAIAISHPDEVIAYNWTKAVPACQIGKSYELSGWIRTENLSDPAWIIVQFWNDAKNEMLGFATTKKDYPIMGTSDWTQVGTVFPVPAGTAEVRIRAGIAAPENRGGRVWFDDLRVHELR